MRRQIEIQPGTASWDAWIEHHRGTKTELVMVKCRHDARPFYAWTEFPPEAPRNDRISSAAPPSSETAQILERRAVMDGDVDAIADRLEAREARNGHETAANLLRKEKLARIDVARERAAAAVQVGIKPKLAELDDVGIRMIDDPFEVKHGRKAKPLRAKLVNLRDDPVGQMEKRKQITPEQLEAARKWQAVHDIAASVGATGGSDPFQMRVSGGGQMPEPINDAQIAAMKRMQKLDSTLGLVGAFVVRQILGERMTVGQVAAMMGNAGERGISRTGDRLRECLDTLVAIMGVEAEGKVRRPRDEAAQMARFADNPLLYQAVRAARNKIG